MHNPDILIIGSGMGGGTLARALAGSGARVLVIERGDFLPREPENWSPEAVFVENRYKAKERWRDAERWDLQPRRPLLRRRQHQGLRRGPAPPARGRLRRARARGRHLPGLADGLRRVRAVLRAGRAVVSGPRRGRRGPDRAAALRRLPLPADAARSVHGRSGGVVSRPGAASLCRCRSGSICDRVGAASAAGPATPSPARFTPRATPRLAASGRPWSTRTSR